MSNRTLRRGVYVSVVSIVTLFAAADADGQTYSPPPFAAGDVRADSLHQAAVEMHPLHDRWEDAARLHEQSARLRSPDDPKAVECLAMAAHLRLYAKRPLEARRTMERAAHRALNAGDVERAAKAFLEAAFMAQQRGDAHEVQRLARRADLLAGSPLLSVAQRSSIRARITRELPAVARVGRP